MSEHTTHSGNEDTLFPEHREVNEVGTLREGLRQEFSKEMEAMPGNDPYMYGIAYAWRAELGNPDSIVYEVTNEVLEQRIRQGKNVHPFSSLAILFRSAFQKQLVYGYKDSVKFQKGIPGTEFEGGLPRGYGNFPFKYRDEEHKPIPVDELNPIDIARDCIYSLRFMLSDERSSNAGIGEFIKDAASFNVMTNKRKRWVGITAIMVRAQEMLERPITVADLGASGNHGLKSIGMHIPQSIDEVVQYLDTTGEEVEHMVREERRDLTARFNALVSTKINLGPSVGMDIWSPYDDGMNNWRKSCTLRGREWLNQEEEDLYDYIENKEVENVSFKEHDLTKGFPSEMEGQRFDFVTMFFMLHQLPPDERNQLIENAKKHGRWIAILDAAELLEDGSLNFRENFYEEAETFPISLIVIDTENPEAGPQLVMQFTDGRCSKVRIFKNRIFERL